MGTASPSFWLDAAILEWTPEFLSGIGQQRPRFLRPHQILDHAYRLLADDPEPFVLADVLSNLKRAVNSRLQHVEEIYCLASTFPKAVGALERLEGVGLAKPFLIRELFELRNDVEHKDATPPSQQRCGELADTTWYFLKTTDYPCKTAVSGVTLRCESGPYARDPNLWLSAQLQSDSTEIFLNGWLPVPLLHTKPLPGSLPLAIRKQRSKTSLQYSDGTPVSTAGIAAHAERGDDERYVDATVVATDALKRKLWTLAFQSL
jgi:hypothetical protein